MFRFGGQDQQKLLILHATGFNGRAYAPLAAALTPYFECYALDFPGHGSASQGVTAADIRLPALTDYLIDAVDAHGLRGCCCFGHSGGGALAVLASCRSAGLFSSIFCFEAVLATPQTHAFMQREAAAGQLLLAGTVLAGLAHSRRSKFTSRQEAYQKLASKPPFAAMQPEAVRCYVEHGTEPISSPSPPPPPQHQQQQHQQQQYQQQQPVQLVCRPSVEAAYYEALSPPPAVPLNSLHCPLALAFSVDSSSSNRSADLASHEAVLAWFKQQQQQQQQVALPSSSPAAAAQGVGPVGSAVLHGDSLHGVLRVLNMELAATVSSAVAVPLPGVSHFGPLEAPQLLAESCRDFFRASGRTSSNRPTPKL